MILDDVTLNVFKNFSSINPTILVLPGNTVTTCNKGPTMFARATVPNKFEKQFAIMELNRFLQAISLFTKPSLEFTDTHIIIKDATGSKRIKYTLASPSAVLAKPDSKIAVDDPDFEMKLSADLLQQIQKTTSILSSDEVVFYGANGRLMLKTHKSSNQSQNVFEVDLGEAAGFKGEYKLDVENLKYIISGEYNVKFSKAGLVAFEQDWIKYYMLVRI